MSNIAFFLLTALLFGAAAALNQFFNEECDYCEPKFDKCMARPKTNDNRNGLEIIAEEIFTKMIEKTRVKIKDDKEILRQVRKNKEVFHPSFTYQWCDRTLDAERYLFLRYSFTNENKPYPTFWQTSQYVDLEAINATIYFNGSSTPQEEYRIMLAGRRILIESGKKLTENC